MQIVSVRVCNAARTVCDSVAALNSAALVMVVVRNTGAVAAEYTLSFGNCSHPTQPVPAQSLTLDASETAEVRFEVCPAPPTASSLTCSPEHVAEHAAAP